MKWIGQHIYDQISRFRDDVYLEDIKTGTIVSGGSLGLDSNNKIVKASTSGGISFDGSTANGVLTFKDSDEATVESNLTFDGNNLSVVSATEAEPVLTLKTTHTTVNKSGELKFLKDAADTEDGEALGLITFNGEDEGNNQTRFAQIKAAIAESDEGQEGGKLLLAIATHDAELQNGLQLIDGNAEDEVDVTIASGAASVTTVAGTLTMGSTATINNSGVVQVAAQTVIDHDQLANFVTAEHVDWAGSSAGTIHSSNIPTLNQDTSGEAGTVATIAGLAPNTATTQATQPNITTLAGLTSIGAAGATTNFAAGDITMYNAVNNGNPTISIGSSDTERLEIKAEYETGAQGIDLVRFTTFTAGSAGDDGRYAFEVDDAFLLNILDGGLRIKASGFLEFGSGNEIISDSSGTTTLKNIDALDATTEATIESAIDTLGNLTAASSLVTVGTIGTGVWNATKILSPKTTHVIHYPFRGYAGGLASGNFQFGEDFADPQAPFQLNQDYGATAIASGSLPDVSDWFRSSGTVMVRAVTATRVYGWVTCGGTDDITIALCKITPTRNSTAAVVPIVVATTVIAAINNDKMDFFDITASDAGTGTGSIVTSAIAQGDILMPFIIVPNAKTAFFNLTLEVEA